MAANPNPAHVTDAMWWFIEEWERLEPETIFAGAWGRSKPGYHCDWNKLESTPAWDDDYSTYLPDDQVGGTWLAEYGAAVDITFPSAQSGNYSKIRKYSDRIKAAWKAFDPRLKGWREILCNCTDNDSAADGFDIPGHYERTPDSTHKWHIHFSVLRKYLADLTIYQAMMSILRGETLTQWENRGKSTMAIVFKYDNAYWISRGDATEREIISTEIGVITGDMNVVCDVHRVYPDKDKNNYPATDLKQPPRSWSEANVDAAFGKIATSNSDGGGSGPAVLIPHTHEVGATGPAEATSI